MPEYQPPEAVDADVGALKGKVRASAVEGGASLPFLSSAAAENSKQALRQRPGRLRRSVLRQPPNLLDRRCARNHRNPTRNNVGLRYVGRELPRVVYDITSKKLIHRYRSLAHLNRAQRAAALRPGSKTRGADPRSLQKYLESRRLISLGSWASFPEASLTDAEHSESRIDEIDSTWSRRFMRLEEGHRLKIWSTRKVEQFVNRYTELIHRFWLRAPKHDRTPRWQDAMLWSLQNSPIRGLGMLLATFKGRAFRPPRHMVQDCLQLLTRHYLYNVLDADPAAIKAIWRILSKFVDNASPEELRSYAISQEVVQLLLKHCDGVQAHSLYKRLLYNRAELHANTMLHFLARFVDMGKLHSSMKLLRKIVDSPIGPRGSFATGIDLSYGQIQAACVKLLRTNWELHEPYPVQSKILTEMLEMGIRPNTAMFNAILLNMIEGRDFETAWQTYDIAKQSNHFAVDAITYGILAKGAKLSGGPVVLERVLREIDEDRSMIVQSPRLASSLLDAICHFSSGNEFAVMLDFYKQHFDLRPLQDLELCAVDTIPQQHESGKGQWPTKHIIGQMILAYNKANSLSDGLIHTYNLYQHFVRKGHPLIAPLAQDDFVPNSYIMAFGKRPETLHYCIIVIKEMLSPDASADPSLHASPTVRTWSLLVDAYMHHRQSQAADKVLKMMQSRGIQPDVVTWNTIIGGFAAKQDVHGSVGAMKRMEAQGIESNARTLRELRRLQDRGALMKSLKDSLESPIKKLVNPEEVEAMADGWDANISSKNREVHGYLQSFSERHL